MSTILRLPRVGANDDTAVIVHWAAGDQVVAGQVVCEIETAKAAAEVEAESAGHVVQLVAVGDTVEVGHAIAVILDDPNEDYSALLDAPMAAPTDADLPRWTKKAELVAARMGIDISKVSPTSSDGLIREEDVLNHKLPARPARSSIERVAVIGSVAGGGAAIVVDIILRSLTQVCLAIYDRDPDVLGSSVLGVPVVGPSDYEVIEAAWRRQEFDSVILAFNRNLASRREAFAALSEMGVPFTNAIDATVNRRSGVLIGTGNVIAGSSYLGAEAEIGDNNFLSSNTCIEHHAQIGSHCAFGPGVTFSGRVSVGDEVRFGTQIAVEPGVTIGSGSVISSSVVLTTSVPANSVVKTKVGHTIAPLSKSRI
ncbi:biotin/lipoyl-containing protein [Devosia alba]|uniref:biotin/lipoyl-containing protein n=1 Tax=Devosia alba TaxID=3152360 RepID=UPI00326451B1